MSSDPFTIEITAPVAVPGFTRMYGGPNQGGHTGPEWYIHYGMDIGGSAGTPVYSAFDGHVTKFQPHVQATDGGTVYGARIFVRSHNDRMGGFYTHLREVPDQIGAGSRVAVGDFLGRVHEFGGIPPHLHLAMVEIIGDAPGGQYMGVDLYQLILKLQSRSPDLFVPVQFWQDGRPPQPIPRAARMGKTSGSETCAPKFSPAYPLRDDGSIAALALLSLTAHRHRTGRDSALARTESDCGCLEYGPPHPGESHDDRCRTCGHSSSSHIAY